MSHSSSETFIAPEPAVPPSRRDFLYLATGSVAAVGAAAMVVPLVDQMNPDASTLAATGPVDIDISKIQPGQRIVALWAAKPVFILNRPQAVLDELRDPKHIARLLDPNSENPATARLRGQLEPFDQARVRGYGGHLHPSRLRSAVRAAA